MKSWEVRLFSYLREQHGERVRVDSEGTAGALMEALAREGIGGEYCRLAVNLRFVEADELLREGDEIALIPPVSGG